MPDYFIADMHLDLSMNALEWNRDLRKPIHAINRREAGMNDKPDRGNATISFDELRKGNIGFVVATQIGRYVSPDNPLPGWHSSEQAWAQTQGQLAWYKAMEADGQMTMIRTKEDLDAHLSLWNDSEMTNKTANKTSPCPLQRGIGAHCPPLEGALHPYPPLEGAGGGKNSNNRKPIGYLLSLEGADSLITVDHVERAYRYGLRAVGPAHYGPGRYANGTDSSGRLNGMGIALLRKMDSLGMILDITHLNDDAFWHALEIYQGPVWASHHNCRALVDHNRQLSDEMIKALIERKAVIGVALDAWMMVPGWIRGQSTPQSMNCSLEIMVDHIEHICRIAGNTQHVAIGSDLDGGYGTEQCPYDVKTIADLQQIPAILRKRGYSEDDIQAITSGNLIRFVRQAFTA